MTGLVRLIRHSAAACVAFTTLCKTGLAADSHAVSSALPDAKAIRDVMQRVADWQLVNPSASSNRYTEDCWTWGAFYTGLMAYSRMAENPKYHDYLMAMGKRFDWKPAKRIYHADDHCVSQTYLELYMRHHDPAMLKPTQERMDYILAHPSTNDMHFKVKGATDRWSWCDSLFMSPPVWVRLYAAAGDERYLDYMNREWWNTTAFLYDTNEHLYFRDSTYFDKREANGRKVFWSRGNGWVIAGIARVLDYLPPDRSERARFEKLFVEMANRILECQQPDGLWRASLLDPESYPMKETSGSGFFIFALAWGVNHQLLERARFEPAIVRGWTALVECVDADGKLTHVQPVGADPKHFDPSSSDVYGGGAFLLAGSELYKLVSR